MKKALHDAFKLLGYREYTTSEMEQRLKKKGYGQDIITAVIGYLQEQRYLDDRQFIRSWILRRCRERPVGRRWLVQELRARGLAEKLIMPELEDLYPAERELELAWALACKKWAATTDDHKKPERIARFLQGKGFVFGVIKQVLLRLHEEKDNNF